MSEHSRHQCLVYTGAPSHHLPSLANTILSKLAAGYRCLYLNSPTMVAGMRSTLAALGLDIASEVAKGRLDLSSEQNHLENGVFDPDRMLSLLRTAFEKARADGYVGLWASGDMAWEFGQKKDFAKLLEYEQRLEAFLEANPAMCGVCQYHLDVLPKEIARVGIAVHRTGFLNDMLSQIGAVVGAPGVRSGPETA